MNKKDVEKGMKVIDKWFTENGVGEIVSVKENETRVKYKTGIRKYNNINLADLVKSE
jgi:hypothetical protein